jgi:hypothetical protein
MAIDPKAKTRPVDLAAQKVRTAHLEIEDLAIEDLVIEDLVIEDLVIEDLVQRDVAQEVDLLTVAEGLEDRAVADREAF